jgi:hypothetical protein
LTESAIAFIRKPLTGVSVRAGQLARFRICFCHLSQGTQKQPEPFLNGKYFERGVCTPQIFRASTARASG